MTTLRRNNRLRQIENSCVCPEGREVYFWAMAERELRGEAAVGPSSPA